MAWAAIGFKKKSAIVFCSTKMNQHSYKDLLENHIKKKGKDLAGPGWKFQQDNASIHKAKTIMDWFSKNKVAVVDWPVKSPDLNIIENLWSTLSRKVYTEGRQYRSTNDLKQAIEKSWQEINQGEIDKLYESLPGRIFEVIKNQGSYTHY
jgi:DDE superfamily endonuclease